MNDTDIIRTLHYRVHELYGDLTPSMCLSHGFSTIAGMATCEKRTGADPAVVCVECYVDTLLGATPPEWSPDYHRLPGDPRELARRAVASAIKRGRLVRPGTCSHCLRPCKPEGHHRDYAKPLEVVWLCRECHMEVHDELRQEAHR